MTTCFLLMPTGNSQMWMRRRWPGPCVQDGVKKTHHYAEALWTTMTAAVAAQQAGRQGGPTPNLWPKQCNRCGATVDERAPVHRMLQLEACPLYTTPSDPIPKPWMRNYRKSGTPGMMWFCPYLQKPLSKAVSPEYRAVWAGVRPPLRLVVPGGYVLGIDEMPYNVTGDAPLVTVAEPISVPGYAGTLTAGVLSDNSAPPPAVKGLGG